MSETVLHNVPFLTCGHEHFIASKFSGLKDVDFSYSFSGDEIIIKYFTEIYFSGNSMKILISKAVPMFKNKTFPFNIFSKLTPVGKFIVDIGGKKFWEKFNESGYEPAEKTDFIPASVQWFAEKTGTLDILEELKESMRSTLKFCDKYIDKGHNERKKK